ncbi:hypothetical protein FGM00_15255 [Aggregatimonas sangjinii]|uniref:Uncharacterized protein n=1 Tax=Aggregatimonas sangjinii TaxID=2583587 RepID=A0A5B7SXG9_9FLAO|nr:hypothetical protein [Aggregatimonas sangjinii]QCX01400.1 hypothetical protein FGM00_15255 [Aggregatimonas sangjinii]
MEILFYLATFCLVLFMILATYDGFFLHIWKYELFRRPESAFEHKTHTIRAILFPLIVWCLFLNETSWASFLLGVSLVVIDLIVLAIDAYSEQESRSFMGGLPRWEYLIHLFSNAFHFSAIALVLAFKLRVSDSAVQFVSTFAPSPGYEFFTFISANVIPGALLLALLHFVLMLKKPQAFWNNCRTKVICC